MKTTNWKISDLKEAEYNPRRLTEKQHSQLKKSIEKFGFIDPIIVNTHPDRHGVIVGGHQRCKVARELGMKEVPAVEVHLTEEEEKELNVRHNKTTGEWDFDMLANWFEEDDLLDWGFSEKELGLSAPMDEEEQEDEPEKEQDTCPTCLRAL